MPTITSIEPQKNPSASLRAGKNLPSRKASARRGRVNIYLDGKFGFGLDLENFVKLGLKIDKELTEAEIEKIIKEGEFQKVYDKILLFGSLRPRSEREYYGWLRKHQVPKNLYDELFNRLKGLDFLNDKKFAVWWIDQRIQFRSKSKRELIQELRLKGISKDAIEEVLSETQPDEVVMARKLIAKKNYMWEKVSDSVARRKRAEFLLRRGFGWDIIKQVVDKSDDFY